MVNEHGYMGAYAPMFHIPIILIFHIDIINMNTRVVAHLLYSMSNAPTCLQL